MPERKAGLYNGQSKDTASDCIFAIKLVRS